MEDMSFSDIMLELGRNYPEWIKDGIGEKLDNMVKSLDNIDKSLDKKSKNLQKDVEKSQQNSIKAADNVTRFSEKHLGIMNDFVKSSTFYKKAVDDSAQSQNIFARATKKSTELMGKDAKRREKNIKAYGETIKSIETYNNILKQATNNIRNVRNTAVSMSVSLDRLEYSNAIDKFGDSLSDVAESFGLIGSAIGAAVLGVSQFAQITVQHAQKLQTTFSTLNQNGLFLSGGLTRFAEISTKATMTLDSLGKVAGKSASTIAVLGGEEGLLSIGRVNTLMRDTESIFRKYGMTIQEINEYQADSLERERTLGHIQQLSEKDRLNRMSTEIQRFATLSTIMGKSVKEIQDAGTSALEVPETQAMLMQATRGLSKEERAELNREVAMVAESGKSKGYTPEMIEITKRQHIMAAAREYGNEVTSIRGTRSVTEFETFAPEWFKIQQEMSRNLIDSDVTAMSDDDRDKLIDSNIKLLENADGIFARLSEGPLPVLVANDIDAGLSYSRDMITSMFGLYNSGIGADELDEVRDRSNEIRDNEIDPLGGALATVENLINKVRVFFEGTKTTTLRALTESEIIDKLSSSLETLNTKVEGYIDLLSQYDPEKTFVENINNLLGEKSALARSVTFLTDHFTTLAWTVGGLLGANAALTAVVGGSMVMRATRKLLGNKNVAKAVQETAEHGARTGSRTAAASAANSASKSRLGQYLDDIFKNSKFVSKILKFTGPAAFLTSFAEAFFNSGNAQSNQDVLEQRLNLLELELEYQRKHGNTEQVEKLLKEIEQLRRDMLTPEERMKEDKQSASIKEAISLGLKGENADSDKVSQLNSFEYSIAASINDLTHALENKLPTNDLITKLSSTVGNEKLKEIVEELENQGYDFSNVKIPAMATGGVALGPLLAQIGEGSSPEMVLPLDPAMSDLSKHISEQFIELVFPKFEHLQDKLIKTLFRDNRDVIDKTYTKSLDKFFFSKDDVMTSVKRHLSSTASEHDIEKRGLMQAMGNNVGGFEAGMLSSPSLNSMAESRSAYNIGGSGSGGGMSGGGSPLSGNKSDVALKYYEYMVNDLGLSHEHAMGALVNIKRESAFNPAAFNGRGEKSHGLFQFNASGKYGQRGKDFLNAVPDWKTNWKGQIKYMMTQDSMGKRYANKSFSSESAAANYFTKRVEVPAARFSYISPGGYNDRNLSGLQQSLETSRSRSQEQSRSSTSDKSSKDNPYTDNNGSIIEDDAPINQISYDDLMPPPTPKVAPASKYNNDDGSGRSEISRILTSIDSKLDKLNRNIGNSQGKVFTA